MNKSSLAPSVLVVLSLVIGFGAGYIVFREPALSPTDNLTAAITSLLDSKTSQGWSVRLSGTVKSWGDNTMELQGEGGTTPVRIVADSNTQFIDSTAKVAVPAPKSFDPKDIAVGDKLEVIITFDKDTLLRAGFINRIKNP